MTSILYAILVLGALGALFGAILAIASKVFYVEVDPKVEAIRECLAGANCGGCGYPGCDGYAAAVAAGKAPTNRCVAGGADTAARVAEIMGVSTDAADALVAFVPCSGVHGVAEPRFNYSGPEDCRAAMLFGGKSNKMCTFACIGLGNCVRACPFDAMHIVNGVAKVDRSKCVGCGSCVEACPKSIVKLLPASQIVMPACSSKAKGRDVMQACTAGCIACGKCERECPVEAITMIDNLPFIDVNVCTKCGHCADICPKKIIVDFTK